MDHGCRRDILNHVPFKFNPTFQTIVVDDINIPNYSNACLLHLLNLSLDFSYERAICEAFDEEYTNAQIHQLEQFLKGVDINDEGNSEESSNKINTVNDNDHCLPLSNTFHNSITVHLANTCPANNISSIAIQQASLSLENLQSHSDNLEKSNTTTKPSLHNHQCPFLSKNNHPNSIEFTNDDAKIETARSSFSVMPTLSRSASLSLQQQCQASQHIKRSTETNNKKNADDPYQILDKPNRRYQKKIVSIKQPFSPQSPSDPYKWETIDIGNLQQSKTKDIGYCLPTSIHSSFPTRLHRSNDYSSGTSSYQEKQDNQTASASDLSNILVKSKENADFTNIPVDEDVQRNRLERRRRKRRSPVRSVFAGISRQPNHLK